MVRRSMTFKPFSRLLLCFFFSSRRRHTRFKCDWSSDVCSSDLRSRVQNCAKKRTRAYRYAGLPPVNLYARVRFFAQFCTRDRGCSAHPAFPAPSSREDVCANLGQTVPREGEAMFGEAMFGNGPAGAAHSLSSPAHAGDPVRRGLSARALLSLEYWIARSRLRQGFAEASTCWRAEALAEAASRATTSESEI